MTIVLSGGPVDGREHRDMGAQECHAAVRVESGLITVIYRRTFESDDQGRRIYRLHGFKRRV